MTFALIGLGLLILATSVAGIIGFKLARTRQLKAIDDANIRVLHAISMAPSDPLVLADSLRRGGHL